MKKRFFPLFGVLCLLSAPLSWALPHAEATPDIPALEKSAADGDAQAKYLLGKAYFRSQGVPKDIRKSLKLLEESAALGNAEAMDGLGYLYLLGEGVPKDEAKAVEWFRKSAEKESRKGQLHLGLMLRQGKTIPLSNEESLLWIHKAADGGLPEAQAVLGRLYFLGDSLQGQDVKKAIPYLQSAAESGDAICENMLGVAYRDASGVEENDSLAEEWFRKAARQNNVKAQSNLAQILGVESPDAPKRQEALMWLIVSSEQGEITAKKTFGEIEHTLPSTLLASAKKEANRYLLRERMTSGATAKKPQAAETENH